MVWTGIVAGKYLLVWLQGLVNGEGYLEFLTNTLWPSVEALTMQRQYWYQQDGATSHVTTLCLNFLKSKFRDRIMSSPDDTAHQWSANSPD